MVQNQNCGKTPERQIEKQEIQNGRTIPPASMLPCEISLRQFAVCRHSLHAQYKTAKTANRAPCCFIRKASPKHSPLMNRGLARCVSIASSRRSVPANAVRAIKCVACPSSDIVDSRSASSVYEAAATVP